MGHGIFEMDERAYRANINAVSISELNLFRIAPLLYEYRILKGNRDYTNSKAKDIGTGIHKAVLEPHLFMEEYVRLPDLDLRTTSGKQEKKLIEAQNPGKKTLSADDYDRLVEAGNAVNANPVAKGLLMGCVFERSFFWTDTETGVPCKGRADAIQLQGDYVVDLKSTKDARNFIKSVTDYGYHRQAAYYLDGLSTATGREFKKWYWIAVETEAPYLTAVYEADFEMLAYGRGEYKESLFKFKQCRERGTYPGLPGEVQTLKLPHWYLAKNEHVLVTL